MSTLGNFEKVALRDIWKHEEKDFSKWLSQNLELLGSVIDINMALKGTESAVGGFSLDIAAVEEGTNRKVIIENQLEDTNHDHLGKIITYAAGKDASVVVWIVKKARDEHRRAIDWLNEHTDESIGFFLVQIELWKIDDSKPAPRFSVISRPNDWAKAIKTEGGLSDTQQLQYRYWQTFIEYAVQTDFTTDFSLGKAAPAYWYSLYFGVSGAQIVLSINSQKAQISTQIYISDDKELYHSFEKHRGAIEEETGLKLEWQPQESKKASKIIVTIAGNIKHEDKWMEYFKWYMDVAKKMKKAFSKHR